MHPKEFCLLNKPMLKQAIQQTRSLTCSGKLNLLSEKLNQTKNKQTRHALILAYSFAQPIIFARYFFPEYITSAPADHHDAFFTALDATQQGQHVNILAPRGSAKSTCMAVIYPIWRVYFKSIFEMLDMPVSNFIVIISRSEAMAISRIYDMKRKLETHSAFISLVNKKNWRVKDLITNNGTKILPRGRGSQIRGSLFGAHRPDLIICDDLDDPETVTNPEVRAKDQLWFDTDLMRAGSIDSTSNFITIDTVKHPESTANLLRERPDWRTLLFRAIESPADLWHPTHEEHWKQWEKIYTDMTVEQSERQAKAQAFYESHLAQTAQEPHITHLWKDAITYLDVRKEICNVGYYPVLRELQNSTHDPNQALFDMENAIQFDIVQEGFLRSDKVLVNWNEMAGATIFLDWAGGKDIKDNCYAAVVGVVWVPLPGKSDNTDSFMNGVHGYVLDAFLKRVGAPQQITACLDMHEHIKATVKTRDFKIRFGIEGFVQDTWDAQRQAIERDFKNQRQGRSMEQNLHIEWLPRLRNKFDRIDALQAPIRNGWLMFHTRLPPEFYKQMSLYPTADFVDAPDALEGACQMRISTFPSEHKQRRERARKRNEQFRVEI